jgi:hypothetical protein
VFQLGEGLVRGATPIAVLTVAIVALQRRLGNFPTGADVDIRVRTVLWLRWFALIAVGIGLILMAAGSA